MSQQIKLFKTKCQRESIDDIEQRINEFLTHRQGWLFKSVYQESKKCDYCPDKHDVFVFVKDEIKIDEPRNGTTWMDENELNNEKNQ